MKPLPSIVVATAIALSLTIATTLSAQAASSPVNDLAKKLKEDPREREEAGKRLEAFLLTPDSTGKSFVSTDADRVALGASAREWAKVTEPGRLATLLFVATPESKAESRLRALLLPWTGNAQIKKDAASRATAAFLSDAGEKAAQLLNDPRTRQEIDAAIQANDQAPAVTGARESIERARKLLERRGDGNTAVFGPDRSSPDLNKDSRTRQEIDAAIQANDQAPAMPHTRRQIDANGQELPPAANLPLSLRNRKTFDVPSPGSDEDKKSGTPGEIVTQIDVNDGHELWDMNGLVFRMTKNHVTTYNRELQKTQRQMNLNRPPEAAAIPETGRYNYEMFQQNYLRFKNKEQEYVNATRIDRMIAIAELLNKQFSSENWFNVKGMEDDLIRQAKAKSYVHRGVTASVFDIAEAKFTQRRAYLEGVKTAVLRFETDMNRFKASGVITDSKLATMSLDEQNAMRWLSLTVLEMQMFHVKNMSERQDPASPDAQALLQVIDKAEITPDQKVRYKEQGRRMKDRSDALGRILETTRKALDNAGGLDSGQAALASTQKELRDLSVEYGAMLTEITSKLPRSRSIWERLWKP